MSNFTNLYDGIKTRIETVLPAASGYMRLYDPYDLTKNPDSILRKAWGIAIGESVNTRRQLSCTISIRTDIIVTLTRKVMATDNDSISKTNAEKDLMDDRLLLVKDFCDNSDLPNTIGNVEFISNTKPERIYSDKQSFLGMQVVFTVEYFEQAN